MKKREKLQLKESVGWICQKCSRPCRRSGESAEAFWNRLTVEAPGWLQNESGAEVPIGAFTMTSVQTGQGVIALCSGCALCYVRPFNAYPGDRHWKREVDGQLTIPFAE